MLRWLILGCLVLSGCGIGKKPNEVNTSFGKSTPTYEWKRPATDLAPPVKAEQNDPF